ncbi:MAG: hypothetical protein RLZ45_2541 [Verrucomicrobiota bacterium]
MDPGDLLNGFQFQENLILNNEVRSEGFTEMQVPVSDRNGDLPLDFEASTFKFSGEHNLVDVFEQPRTKITVNLQCCIDDDIGKQIPCRTFWNRFHEIILGPGPGGFHRQI